MSIGSRSLSRTIVTGCVSSLMLVLPAFFLLLLSSSPASAGTGPLIVWGFVYDEEGSRLQGAYVDVYVLDKDTNAVKTELTGLPYPTGSDGAYTATFAPEDWVAGDKVKAIATFGTQSVSNQVTVVEEGPLQVDLDFRTAIPQFGSMLGFLVAAGVVCIVGIAFVSLRRKR